MAAKVLNEQQWKRLEETLTDLEKNPPKRRLTVTEFLRQNREKIAQLLKKYPQYRPIDVVRSLKAALKEAGVDASEQTMREVIRGRRGILKTRAFKIPTEASGVSEQAADERKPQITKTPKRPRKEQKQART